LRRFEKQAPQVSTLVHEHLHAFRDLGTAKGTSKFLDEFVAEISGIAAEMKVFGANPVSRSAIRRKFEKGGYEAVARDVLQRYGDEIGNVDKVMKDLDGLF
jgi:hypothetical protein